MPHDTLAIGFIIPLWVLFLSLAWNGEKRKLAAQYYY